MVILLRSTDGNPDSRFEKYVDFLSEKGIQYLTICWDRKGIKTNSSSSIYYKKTSDYNQYYGNLSKLIGFNCFILRKLIARRREYNIIHACDFDTVLPAIFMHLFFGKRVIYDIFDWYVDSRNIKGVIKYIVYAFEWLSIKSASVVIVCEPERIKQIIFKPKCIWLLPNIPNFAKRLEKHDSNDVLTLGYVGILGTGRCVEHAIRYAKEHADFVLEIAGFGPLESELKDLKQYQNIHYHGTVKYSEALQILNSSDVILACYSKWNADGTPNRNNILAAPNKYYEGLYLAHPILTTKGTAVGNKTIAMKTGYVIDESYEDFCEGVKTITREKNIEFSNNADALWTEKYSNFVKVFFETTYLPFIKVN